MAGKKNTVDGCEIHFAPPKKPWLKPLRWLVLTLGDRIMPGCLSYKMLFIHSMAPQGVRTNGPRAFFAACPQQPRIEKQLGLEDKENWITSDELTQTLGLTRVGFSVRLATPPSFFSGGGGCW